MHPTSPTRRRPTAVPAVVVLALTAIVLVAPVGPRVDVLELPRIVERQVVPVTEDDRGPFGTVSAVTEPGIDFSMVVAEAPAGALVDVSVRDPDGEWSEWIPLLVGHDHGHSPDDGHGHAPGEFVALPLPTGPDADPVVSDPAFVDHGTALRVRVTDARPEDVLVTVQDAHRRNGGAVDRVVVPEAPLAAALASTVPQPEIISRSIWGAAPPTEDLEHATAQAYVEVSRTGEDTVSEDGDEPYVDLGPDFDVLGAGVVHHTASSRQYAEADVAGIIRSIQSYHQDGRGWADIGYNFVVDRFGRIWEGRGGGIDRATIGAHSGGWNTTSFGVAMLGDFRDGRMPSEAAVEAVADLFAWKFGIHGLDPHGTHTWPNGETRGTVVGHRDLNATACPGDARVLLPQLREMVAERMAGGGVVEEEPTQTADHGGRFTDVPPEGSLGVAVYSLADRGVIAGCRDDAFCPEGTLTRGEVASFLSKAYGFAPNDSGRSIFSDVDPDGPIGPWVDGLVQRGIINGFTDGTFRGSNPVTRGELMALLGRLYDLEPSTGTQYPDVDPDSVIGGWVYAMTDVGFVASCDGVNFCTAEPMTRAATVDLIYIAQEYGDRLGLVQPAP